METTEFNRTIDELLNIGNGFKLFEQQKNELQKEKERLEEMTQKLTEQMIEQQIDQNEKYTIMNTKYNCCMEELSQFKERCNEKNIRINQLEKQQTMENERLTSAIAEQIMLENTELKRLLTDRDAEIIRLTEQLKNLSKEFEQRISKLKIDFGIMYEKQSTFFLEKLALLKAEQNHHIDKLYQST